LDDNFCQKGKFGNKYLNSSTFKNFVIVLWLASVFGVGSLLLFEDKFFALSGTPIAKVGKTQNHVTYRSEEDTRWKFIGDTSQFLFDGDRLATGRKSQAMIDFGDGRIANIGEDTTVSLSAIRQQNGLTYILSMPSGSVGIEKSKTAGASSAQFPIIIRSGGRDFYIEPEEEKGVLRSEKGIQEFKGKRTTFVKTSALAQSKGRVNVSAPTNGAAQTSTNLTPSGAVPGLVGNPVEDGLNGDNVVVEDQTDDLTEFDAPPIASLSPVLLEKIATDLAITIPDPVPVPSALGLAGAATPAAQTPISEGSPPATSLSRIGDATSKSAKDSQKSANSKSAVTAKTTSPKISDGALKLASKSGVGLSAVKKAADPVRMVPAASLSPLPPAVAGTEIKLDTSAVTAIYYSFKPLSQIKGPLGDLGLKPPASTPPGWQPLLELSNGSSKRQITDVKGGQRNLSVEDFGSLTANSMMDGLACADLGVRGGARISDANGQRVSVAKDEFKIKICSYRDASNNVPLAIGVSTLEGESSKRPMIFSRPSANELRFQMITDSPRLYLTLLPLMQGSPNFRVGKVSGFSQSGIFIAKGGKVIMQLAGPGFTAKTADAMLKLTGGDFVYKGPRSALYDATSYSADQLKDWVSKSVDGGRKVYVHRLGNLLPISKDFLEERREVAVFVKTVASQLFTEKVDIIAFR
jgi:hypothetical protein